MVSKKTILVVEDSALNRELLKGILAAEYAVLEAENGEEALSVLNEQGETISLILLDIMMPVMDGYTFLSIVKANPVFSSIPVIVTPQNDSESDEVNALAHGAADFVAKPYRPQVLLHRVASIINLRETAAIINLIKYDHLTGLYGKEFFCQKIKEILHRNLDKQYDIICSDIDNFKLINDVFGVAAGDRILCGIAELYTQFWGETGICSRFNADQFTCLVEHRQEYTDEIFQKVSEQINELPNARNVVVKWGIYPVHDRTLSAEQMCDRALLAARSIKGQYRKFFARYDDALRSKLLREQEINASMESALQSGQFEVYLQPKYSLKNDGLAGAEALVRWNHPEWGIQSPGEFIPMFERNGFITRLDQYVWDRTCAILREWDEQGLPQICVSVNVSRADIYNADTESVLLDILQKHQIEPFRLHLEITESAYTENPKQIIDVVGRLRRRGFIIEMDDFGSGYSSLNMLNELPIDVLKLDMKFIQNETAKPFNQGILQFIISLARWMNLQVVAEGVETKDQLERLRAIGCDYVQGYYFAKPMPCERFEAMLKQAENLGSDPNRSSASVRPRFLVVADEDREYRRAVSRTFEDGFKVLEADNGAAMMEYISRYGTAIEGIILSLTLTNPDGIMALKMLQSQRSIWNIPVIATGPQDEHLEGTALEFGADDFAAKPHLQTTLHKRLMRIIRVNILRMRERVLQEEACRDYLTGLLNRRGMTAAVEALHSEDCPLAVYLFDLDDLKKYNDNFGHQEGDHYLIEFAAILRTYTKGSDILARFGGDEFAVVMKQMWMEQNVIEKGEEICSAVTEHCSASQSHTSCSCGAVMWNLEIPFSEVLKRADQALYRVKTSKKGGCYLWRSQDDE